MLTTIFKLYFCVAKNLNHKKNPVGRPRQNCENIRFYFISFVIKYIYIYFNVSVLVLILYFSLTFIVDKQKGNSDYR